MSSEHEPTPAGFPVPTSNWAPYTVLPRTGLTVALRRPGAWLFAAVCLAIWPGLAHAIRLVPQAHDQDSWPWVAQLCWLACLLGLALGLWWLPRARAFEEGMVSGQRSIARLLLFILAGGVPVCLVLAVPATLEWVASTPSAWFSLLAMVFAGAGVAVALAALPAPSYVKITMVFMTCWLTPALLAPGSSLGGLFLAQPTPFETGSTWNMLAPIAIGLGWICVARVLDGLQRP